MTDVDHSALEEEGEIAADYLEEFLDIVDLDGDIELDVRNGRAAVDIIGNLIDLKALIGEDARVLDALQDLTRLAVQNRTGLRSRLMLDIAGYRAKQVEDLNALATSVIKRVVEKGRPEDLEPMNAFERKVVHDAVATAGLVSESHGVDPYRYVTITTVSAA
jgi:spoIIIJ-associated protein